MTFEDTMKLHAAGADDDNNYGDEADDHDDLHRFDDDEEEEVTMTSDDDDEELDNDNDELQATHAEDAMLFSLPPSPVNSYEPPTKASELPVKSVASTSTKSV